MALINLSSLSSVMSQLPFMSHVTSQLIVQSHVTSQLIFQSHVTSQLIVQRHVTSSAELPEPCHVSADLPESRYATADRPESRHILSVAPRSSRSVLQYSSLVSSVRDAPLVSARTAGIPKPSHSNPAVPELISHDGDRFMLRLGCVHHHRTARGGGVHCDVSRGGG